MKITVPLHIALVWVSVLLVVDDSVPLAGRLFALICAVIFVREIRRGFAR